METQVRTYPLMIRAGVSVAPSVLEVLNGSRVDSYHIQDLLFGEEGV